MDEADESPARPQGPSLLPTRLLMWAATGLNFGYAPWAPGTVGALWGLPLAWLVSRLPGWPLQAAVVAGLCLLAIPVCTRAARRLALKDPQQIVLDEIVTVPITFLLAPTQLMNRPEFLLLGFALHRLFDITKPSPARQAERFAGGTGIVADDVVAGIYACFVLQTLLWAWRWLGSS